MQGTRSATRRAIISELDRGRNGYVTFLQDLIRAASPNPPGDTTEAATVILQYLSNHGLAAQTQVIEPLEHAPNVVALFAGEKGQGPRVILNGQV